MLNPLNVTMDDIVMEANDFAHAEIPERKVLLNPWLLEETITLISGTRGCGKSWFGFSILDAITKGQPLGPWEAPHPVPCFYLDGEMHISDTQTRFMALGTKDRKAPLYVYSDALAALYGVQTSSLLRSEWRKDMEELLLRLKVKVFALDNIASLSPGIDENTKQAWDPVNQWLLRLRFRGISTLLFHHLSKSGTQRGTSAREDNIDVSIMLQMPADYVQSDGCRFNVNFTKRRSVSENDSALIEPRQFHLFTESFQARWKVAEVSKKNEDIVLQMLSDGYRQTDICEALQLSKGYVSKIVKHLMETNRIESFQVQKYIKSPEHTETPEETSEVS